ncbi:hypothetical protein Tco_1193296 [Tanacetum coccineum]
MKEEQRFWTVILSGFQELEVRKGIPCVHSMAAYLFLNKEPDEGVYHWYSQERWFEAYQFSIKPIHVHNIRHCDKELVPKPPQMKKHSGRKREPNYSCYTSNKGGGIGEASGGLGEASGGLGEANDERGEASSERVQAIGRRGQASGGRGRARGRGGRSGRLKGRGSGGQGRSGRGRNGGTNMLVDEQYMEQLLIKEDEKRIAAKKSMQEEFDKEAVRLTLEEEARYEKECQDRLRDEEEFEFNKKWYNHDILSPLKSACTRVEGINVDVQP